MKIWFRQGLIATLAIVLAAPAVGLWGQSTAHADETATWLPIDTAPMIVKGSALDLSGLNDVPAGKYGFIQQDVNGNYNFERTPQKKVKLYGANVTWNMYYGTREEADLTVDRLARIGYNVVRIHPADSMTDWAPGIFLQNGSTTPQFNKDKLDRLEYFISRLKANGIYVAIDVFHLYNFSNIPGLGEYAEGDHSPYLLPFLPQALGMWKEIATKWLSHVNPYTGLALKDDPVLVGVSPWNESLLLNMDLNAMKQPFRNYMLKDFNSFLATLGDAPVTSIPSSYWSADGKMFDRLSAYYSKKTITVSNAMRTYLKQRLGIHAPIGGLNFIDSPNVNYWRSAASDVHETHSYYQFVDDRFSENNRSGYTYNPLKDPRLSMAFDPATATNYPKDWATERHYSSYYPALSLRQPYAKPFLLTEFQDTFPAKGREEIGIFNGAIGAYQGWDMMNRFSFGRDISDGYANLPMGNSEQFSITSDPFAILSEAEATLLFRTGAVNEAKPRFVFVWDRTWARDTGAAADEEAYIANMMYIPHLFKSVSVYADRPGKPFTVYKITEELTPKQIASGNLPAANKLNITKAMTDREVAKTFINSLSDNNKKAAMLSALNNNKLLSDTGELVFDLNLNTYLVSTPKTIAIAGTMNNHTFKLGRATVTADVDKGTFFASSLDGKALKNSNRLLLIYKTDVAATGEKRVTLQTGEVKYYKGTLPTLAKQQKAQFQLTTDRPASAYRAYKLTLNGARVQEIPVKTNGNILNVTLNTSKGFTFELVYDPQISSDSK
ncbi:cellulase family glycosylhydrolase [Paenibacillus sp. YIM B09110]|uniref:cellulase family glycosylhydrolase n=1 Tax=Paenibacillus sp. YIM B09110 TaxID=3126102 RepID=UPI00301C197D